MAKLYQPSGYLNMDYIFDNNMPFTFITGGRGTGKTFGALKLALDRGYKFIYLRRTQTQVDMISNPKLNPFNALHITLGERYNLTTKTINKNLTGVYRAEFDSEKQISVPAGELLGVIMALSTFSNLRGFDASDYQVLIYDEFISEKHERPIKNEAWAFWNTIETVNRNRELSGGQPLKVVCLSNSNDLANPLFIELKIVGIVERMLESKQEIYLNNDRGLAVYVLQQSPISAQKATTALYRLLGEDSEFTHMSIDNEFTSEERALIKPQSLKEYRPLCKVGELCIYKHKSERQYYVTEHTSGSCEVYDSSEMDLSRFGRDYYYLWLSYLNRKVIFESYIDQILFEKYFHIKRK